MTHDWWSYGCCLGWWVFLFLLVCWCTPCNEIHTLHSCWARRSWVASLYHRQHPRRSNAFSMISISMNTWSSMVIRSWILVQMKMKRTSPAALMRAVLCVNYKKMNSIPDFFLIVLHLSYKSTRATNLVVWKVSVWLRSVKYSCCADQQENYESLRFRASISRR